MSEKENSVVAVTGASRGIGAAIALELAGAGYTVAALTRQGRGVERDDIDAKLTVKIVPVVCDVADSASIESAITEVSALGTFSALVNNAGIWKGERSAQLSTDDYQLVMDTNARGCFELCRAAYPHFKDNGSGTIVNIGSFYDKLGVPGGLAYCASKAAIGAITRCLAVEWARDRIKVIDVAPGFIETDLNANLPDKARDSIKARIPGGEFGAAEDVGRLVQALLCNEIPFLTGETIYIDGGQGIKE